MRLGVLTATTAFAKTRPKANIRIPLETGISIGRNNANGVGTVPGSWSQVSGIHCKVSGSESTGFTVTDSSTNGTWIIPEDGEAVRVPKKQTRPLLPGQILRLSALADGADRETLPEYRLDLCEASDEGVHEDAVQEVPSQKRQRVSIGANGVSIQKQIAGLRDENQAANEALRREQQLLAELRRSHKGEVQAAQNEKQTALQLLAEEKKARTEELGKLQSAVDTYRDAEKKQTAQHAAALAEQRESLSSALQEKQLLQAALETAQQELTSALASVQGGAVQLEELNKTVQDRDRDLQAAQSRADSEATKSSELQGRCEVLEQKVVRLDQENEAATASLEDARGDIQKLQTDIKFADANYRNLQRVAAPLAAMATNSQAAELSLVDALKKAARECFVRQSRAAVAAQQLREMLPSPDGDPGDEPSQTATYRVGAGDEGGNDQEPTQGMEPSPVQLHPALTEAPATVTSSTPPQSRTSHHAESPLVVLLAEPMMAHGTPAQSGRTQGQATESCKLTAGITPSGMPSESDATKADATAPDDNEGQGPASKVVPRSGSSAQQKDDTQQASAACNTASDTGNVAQVPKTSSGMPLADPEDAGDEEMADDDGDVSDKFAVEAAADPPSANSSSLDGNDNDASMEDDTRNEADIETQSEEDFASVPRTAGYNNSAPQQVAHASILETIELTGGVA